MGCAIARELSRFQLKVALVEKEEDICALTGKANSAIIHTGFDAPVGSLEAKLVVAANPMYDQLAQELDFPFQRVGALLVAVTEEQWQLLPELQRKALRNGVFDVRLLGREQVWALEPELSDQVYGGLAIPRESIVSPYEMAIAMAENAIANGVEFFLGNRVTGIEMAGGAVQAVNTTRGKIKTSWVINAAGMYCDEVAQMVGKCDFTITPRRGEFFIMDKEAPYNLRHIILPVPTRISKGILISPTVSGNLLVGPTAEDVEDKLDTRVTAAGLAQVMAEAQKLLPSLSPTHTITQYAGLRPVRHPEGYTIEASRQSRGYIGISGIRSTGVTSAPAVAAYVRDLAEEVGLKLVPRSNFNPIRRRPKPFASMTNQERAAAVEADPRWGHVVCRCEHVTEAEILGAIHSPLGARSLDAIKRRTRAGMGRCQGGFCGVRVPFILARELGIPPTAVTKKGPGSELLTRPTKAQGGCHA